MAWPTPQDYNEAVQNTQQCFRDQALAEGIVEVDKRGLPRAVCGAFASVYRVTTNGVDYAVRCFLREMPDQQLRYERLSAAISADLLDATVDFEYQPGGLVIGKQAFPIVKMQWVKGRNLDAYVQHVLTDGQAMRDLRDQFRLMVSELRNEGFAHSDLQHGNIIVTDQGLRLVDYDGMYVPQLTGFKSNELGHRNFQHPSRTGDHFGPYLDNFSAWVIDTALTCLIEDVSLHGQFNQGEGLMFRREDFLDPDSSDLFFYLESHESAAIRAASRCLRTIIGCDPMNVPPICYRVPEAIEHPMVTKARAIVAALRAKQEAEAAAAAAEAERQRLLFLAEQQTLEARQREEAERQLTTHEKPEWLDAETAEVLSKVEPRAVAVEPADLIQAASAVIPTHLNAPVPNPPTALEYATILRQSGIRALHGSLCGAVFAQGDGEPANHSDQKNAVFQCTVDQQVQALKLFCELPNSAVKRFEITSRSVTNAAEFTQALVPFELLIEAIEVDGIWYPGLRMPWVKQSRSLSQVLRTSKADFDHTLLREFRLVMRSLRQANLAHGSLEPSNILVSDGVLTRITLVDYDNLCSPELLAKNIGAAYSTHSAFAHPQATPDEFHLTMDNFSAWLIDTMILVWSFDRTLFRDLKLADGAPILDAQDLQAPRTSHRFKVLSQHQTPEISERAQFLAHLVTVSPDSIPDLPLGGVAPNIETRSAPAKRPRRSRRD